MTDRIRQLGPNPLKKEENGKKRAEAIEAEEEVTFRGRKPRKG
jgi:hypothetical protein